MPDKIGIIHDTRLRDLASALPSLSRFHAHHHQDEIILITSRPYVDLAGQSGYFNAIWDAPPHTNFLTRLIFKWRLKKFNFDHLYYIGSEKPAMTRAEKLPEYKGNVLKGWCDRDIGFYQLPAKFALIHVGGVHPQIWPATQIGTLCKKLTLDKITPVLIGRGAVDRTIERIEKICPEAQDFTRQIDQVDMMALARKAQFAVCSAHDDTYLIAFTDCPTLCLYNNESGLPDILPHGKKVIILQDDLKALSVNAVYTLLKDQDIL